MSNILAESITPIPLEVAYDKKKALLGKQLFFDAGLSSDASVSCASCHFLPGSGTNPIRYSVGVKGQEGDINAPTVLNAGFNFVQFWNGRAETLEEQVLGPLINPVEMDSSPELAVRYIDADKAYQKTFNTLYSDGVTMDNIANALAEFERALFTPNARFDRYLRGDKAILSDLEKEGYALFQAVGCISCHNGRNIGGNMYQKIGVIIPYKHEGKTNLGRYEVTGDAADKMVFKVPTLRNISISAPYFHDGSVKTLRDAIADMYEHQLGRVPKEHSVIAIEAFLKTLEGDTPAILEEDYE